MVRPLLVLALALAPGVVPGCTGAATADVALARPLLLTPVADPRSALKRVAEAVRADPESGLGVGEELVPSTERRSSYQEIFATGPERHVLEDYIRTHPELAPPAGYQFGYQRLRDGEGRTYWRMHSLQQGGHGLRALVDAAVVSGPDGGPPRIRLRLGPDDARAVAELSGRHLGERLAVVQDSEVLIAPVVLEPLTDGVLDISPGADEAEAALKQLLGR